MGRDSSLSRSDRGPAPRFRSAAEAEAYLLGFINYELRTRYRMTTRTHDLRRFRRVLGELGWDPMAVPTVHVGGTNGKGSVSWLLERILRAGGLSTGLYTSPHLHTMRERIRVNGRPVSRGVFRDRVALLARVFGDRPGAGFRTTFEHLTALAFLRFQEKDVERAVIEVGLGGRLDATNVIAPGPAVLTPIGLDHRAVLGRTIGAIARDKVHILKRGGEAFVMPQSRTALPVIRDWARRRGIPVHWTDRSVAVSLTAVEGPGSRIRVRGDLDYPEVVTRLLGAHQAANVAAAVAAAERVLDRGRLREAMRRGLSGAVVPGRLHPVQAGGRLVLLDGGHNPGAARAVRDALALHLPGERVAVVVGMARDKDHRSYLQGLGSQMDRFYCCRADSVRAADPARLLARAPRSGRTFPGVRQALEAALGSRASVVLVAGSFLVVAEAMNALGVTAE